MKEHIADKKSTVLRSSEFHVQFQKHIVWIIILKEMMKLNDIKKK